MQSVQGKYSKNTCLQASETEPKSGGFGVDTFNPAAEGDEESQSSPHRLTEKCTNEREREINYRLGC